ncbi:MAG: NAD+ synthase [Robiginitomaculum sp.]|nr:MAG: NAD+ synthase [Robiginitomaculum sp.]
MTRKISIASAQLNPLMGDIAGNCSLIRDARAKGAKEGADLVMTPELGVLGYPPEDLVLKPSAVAACRDAVETLARETGDGGPALLVGAPWRDEDQLYNAVLLLEGGKITARRYKHDLPNYDVFDEMRVFTPGPVPKPVDFRGLKIGLPICEDIWLQDVPRALAAAGADMLLCINGSPFRRNINTYRHEAFRAWHHDVRLPLVFINQVGGQDELVFDGGGFSWDETGKTVQCAPLFVSSVQTSHWQESDAGWQCAAPPLSSPSEGLEADWQALCLGLGDYVNKNGFAGVVLGLSGGVDSALSAAIAVDALGPKRVWCVMMPSAYTSQESLDDAVACAELLGVRYDSISIKDAVTTYEEMLGPLFTGRDADTTEENLQSRLRAVTLMALSNKFGHMLLTTGNKSEMAVGYATLYGDMSGGYNALKDIYKTEVFDLCNWRNAHVPAGAKGPNGPMVPQSVIDKPPSAELKPDQKDQDSLPPYGELDAILHGLIEEEADAASIIACGYDADVVRRIEHLLYLAEHKRRQAPPGVKISRRNFGRDRRYPITNRFRDTI